MKKVNNKVLDEKCPLIRAVNCGDIDRVKILLQNGEDPNIKDCFGNSPLHYAVFCVPTTCGLLNSVKILLEKGADVNTQNHKQKTPLHLLAQRNGHHYPFQSPPQQKSQLCSLLLSYGANVQLKDENGQNALHLAIRLNSPFTSLILKSDSGRGAVNIPNKQGKYPLHIVAFMIRLYGPAKIYMKLIDLLIEIGADINAQDDEGRTPLYNLVKSYYRTQTLELVRAISMFLDFGASGSYVANVGGIQDIKRMFMLRKNCVTSPHEIYGFMSNLNGDYKRQVLPYKMYRGACFKELGKMKKERIGNNSLFDIFDQLGDPRFLSNKELKDRVQSTCLECHFPIYCHLLKYTYREASERVEMFDHAARVLRMPLPIEVTKYIFSFVNTNSLRNVIEASKIPPTFEN